MSRTIKYRVWDNENKSYNDPYSSAYYAMAQDGGLDFYCHGDHMREADPDVYFIEQYTGLTDKNGKEIYEGDIVRNIEGIHEPAICVWDDSNAEFDFRCRDGKYTRDWVLVWNKMYKLSFLNANNIKFKKGMQFGEDSVFNAECILANGGIYHEEAALVIHLIDDNNSLCRGNMTLDKIEKLDKELCALADRQTDPAKIKWMEAAINEHRNSRLYRKMGFSEKPRGRYDIVYFLKNDVSNEELVYSLRSVEKNWSYRRVCFYGGSPANLKPDRLFRTEQKGLNKWQKVRNMIIEACKNDDISEEFWLFNDDFFLLRPVDENMPPQYNGDLVKYAEYIERKQGTADNHTCSLREAAKVLKEAGLTTYNYEVHKPMLINRQKALEIFDKFPNIHAFRSLYGNYWQIGGTSMHDMKIKILNYGRMDQVDSFWQFLSTSDDSFKGGNAGEYIKRKFNKKSRFEKEVNE